VSDWRDAMLAGLRPLPDAATGDAVRTGIATVGDCDAVVAALDFAVRGGSFTSFLIEDSPFAEGRHSLHVTLDNAVRQIRVCSRHGGLALGRDCIRWKEALIVAPKWCRGE